MTPSPTATKKSSAARVASTAAAGAGSDPFSPEFARRWFTGLIEAGFLTQGTVLVPCGAMAGIAALFSSKGFQVKMTDGEGAGLAEARAAGAKLAAAFDEPLIRVKPWHLGPVDLIVDTALLQSLTPEERFVYANRMGRLLAPGGLLVGLFRLESPGGAPPYAMEEDAFRRMLLRYFVPEVLKPAAEQKPGGDTAWMAVLRHK